MGDFLGSYFGNDEELSDGNEMKLIVPMEQPVSVVDMEDVEVLQRNRTTRSRLQELDLLVAEPDQHSTYKQKSGAREAQSPDIMKTQSYKTGRRDSRDQNSETWRDERECDNYKCDPKLNKDWMCCSPVEDQAIETHLARVSFVEEDFDDLSTVPLTKRKSRENIQLTERIILDKKQKNQTNARRTHEEESCELRPTCDSILKDSNNVIMLSSHEDHSLSLKTNPKNRVGKVAHKLLTSTFQKNGLGKLFQRRVSK